MYPLNTLQKEQISRSQLEIFGSFHNQRNSKNATEDNRSKSVMAALTVCGPKKSLLSQVDERMQ
jgi:hypothetical protein